MKQLKNKMNYIKANKFEFLLVLYSFFLPLRNNLSGIVLYFLVLYSIINYKQFIHSFKRAKKQPFFYIALSLFVIHLVGLIYTVNFRYALKDIDIKIPLLLFPLILIGKSYKQDIITRIMKAFILGCLIGGIGSVYNGFLIYIDTGKINSVLYRGMDFVMHSSYFALYLVFSLGYLLMKTKSSEKLTSRNLVVKFIVILLFFLLIVLLNSRAGILSLGITFLFLFFYFLKEKSKKSFYFFIVILLISGSFLISGSGKLFKRFNNLVSKEQIQLGNKNDINKKDLRIAILTVGIETFKKNPIIGVGTGDVKDELIEGYQEYGFLKGFQRNYNAHNQYLQFLIAFGIIGLVIFLIWLFYPLIEAIGNQNYFFMFLIILISFNFLFESMLETKAGVEFFAFFYVLFFISKEKVKNVELLN